MSGRRAGIAAILVLAVALAVRLAIVGLTPDYTPVRDPADYVRHGISIARGDGYPPSAVTPSGGPTALRPPVYPFFLGGIFAVDGGITSVRLVQALLGTLTVGLIGLVAWQLWGGRHGLVAAAVAALAPPLIVVNSALLSEAVFVPLVVGSLAAVLAHRRSRHLNRWAALAGVLVGLATLTRSNAALLMIPLAFGLYLRSPGRLLRALWPVLVLAAAFAVTLAPWAARNAIVLDAFVPVATQGSYTLAGTYNEASRTDEDLPAAWRPANLSPEYARLLRHRSVGEAELGSELRSAVIDYVRRHPTYPAKVALWNGVRLLHLGQLRYAYGSARSTGIGRGLATAGVVGFYPLALLALAGAFTRRVRAAPVFVWAMPLLLLSTVFVASFTRLRAPIDAFLVLLACAAVSSVLERLNFHRRLEGSGDHEPAPRHESAPWG